MQNWQQWIEKNKYNLLHPADFEKKFVETVLACIPSISPEQVESQYPFTDNNGRARRIDFVIKIDLGNEVKLLPIELDGKTKFDTYESFNDTLERQNDLIKQFGILLRYSNKKMLNQPKEIIEEISRVLQQIQQKKDLNLVLLQNLNNYQQDIIQKFNTLSKQTQPNHAEFEHHRIQVSQQLKDMRETITQLTQQNSDITPPKPLHTISKGTIQIWSLMGVLLICVLAFFFVKQESAQPHSEAKPNYIKADKAAFYVGQNVTVCGKVAEIRHTDNISYLNIDKTYPHQPIAFLIWKNKLSYIEQKVGDLNLLSQQMICARGEVKEYKGALQLTIDQAQQILKE